MTDVARIGPFHSSSAGTASPVVLPVCVGATTITDWPASAATSRPRWRPSVTRRARGSDHEQRTEIAGRLNSSKPLRVLSRKERASSPDPCAVDRTALVRDAPNTRPAPRSCHVGLLSMPKRIEIVMDGPPQKAHVVWLVDDVETSCELDEQTPFVIGRSSRAQVRINDDRASRRHAEIYWQGQRWWVRDAGSRNGTYLGMSRIHRPVPLTHGDSVRCGGTTVNFLWPASIHSRASSQPHTLGAPAAPALSPVELDLLLALCSPYATGVDPRSDDAPAPLSNADIADRLHLSEDGVRQRLKRLYPKFALSGSHLSKRRELAARAIESGALGGLER